MHTQAFPAATRLQPAPRTVRRDRAARWVSHLTHPPIIAVVSVALAAMSATSFSAWLWGAQYLALTLLLPMAYVVRQVRRGALTDVQLQQREQRIKPYLITLACMSAGAALLIAGNAPRLLQQVSIGSLVQMLALFLVTLRWKISAHTASIAGLAVLAWRVFGPAGALFCAAVPLVVWSRVRLGRHDAWQAVAGACVGATVAAAVLGA